MVRVRYAVDMACNNLGCQSYFMQGQPSEVETYNDVRAAYRYLIETKVRMTHVP